MKLRSYANPTTAGGVSYRPHQDSGGGFKQEYDPQPGSLLCNVQPQPATKNDSNGRVGTVVSCAIYFDADPGCNANDKFAWDTNDGASKADSLGRIPEIVCDGPAVNQAGRGVWKVMGKLMPV
jgi:hypothetical protein